MLTDTSLNIADRMRCDECGHRFADHGPTGCLVDWLGPQDADGCPCGVVG